jgi:hypothetical protein
MVFLPKRPFFVHDLPGNRRHYHDESRDDLFTVIFIEKL